MEWRDESSRHVLRLHRLHAPAAVSHLEELLVRRSGPMAPTLAITKDTGEPAATVQIGGRLYTTTRSTSSTTP